MYDIYVMRIKVFVGVSMAGLSQIILFLADGSLGASKRSVSDKS